MAWADFVTPPGTDWANPERKGSGRNFNIAMVMIDYPDKTFVVSGEAKSDIYGNPQPEAVVIEREDVPVYYRDLLNTPNEDNRGHTLRECWMQDSLSRYGVDLTIFGAYEMPGLSFE